MYDVITYHHHTYLMHVWRMIPPVLIIILHSCTYRGKRIMPYFLHTWWWVWKMRTSCLGQIGNPKGLQPLFMSMYRRDGRHDWCKMPVSSKRQAENYRWPILCLAQYKFWHNLAQYYAAQYNFNVFSPRGVAWNLMKIKTRYQQINNTNKLTIYW